MEPERKIEKLLRAYAKKRRADAGDSLKLHPVTRRQLQDAVARQFAEPPEEDSVSLWQLFRERWVFLLSFAVLIFFGATLFVPALAKAKFKAKNAVAMSQLKKIGVAAQLAAADNNGKLPVSLDALTNELASDKILTDPVSGKPFMYVAGGEILDELQSNSVLAYSPEDKKGRAVLLADGRVQAMSAGEFEELNRHGLIQRVATDELATRRLEVAANSQMAKNLPAAAPVPAVAAGALEIGGSVNGFGGGGNGGDGATSRADSVSVIACQSSLNNNSQRYRQTLADTATMPPVLAAFEVRQSGNDLAVVDRDGSVYNGSIQPESSTDQSTLLPTAPVAKEKDFVANKAEPVVAQNNYFFRVTGQNRTSKQNVVFSGNLIPLTNMTANARQNDQGINANAPGGSPMAQVAPPSQSLFSNSRITGTVTVDATNQIEINAVPVSP